MKARLYLAAPNGMKLGEKRRASRQIDRLEKVLRDTIERRRPDIIGLDPYVKLHALEENDNGAMDYVCGLLTQLAIDYDIAVDTPHHTRKGTLSAGDADTGRGASGIKDPGRPGYTLTVMSEDEAKIFGINEAGRRAYIQLDSAKVNVAPSSQKATWFKLVRQTQKRHRGVPRTGMRCRPSSRGPRPKPGPTFSVAEINIILTEIDAGIGSDKGQRYYSDAAKATD